MHRNTTMTVGELYERVNSGHIKSDIDVQREIVYDDEKQRLVIDSLMNDIPLPAFYFWEPEDGILETLDGKQRIHAITRFFHNELQYNGDLYVQTDHDVQDRLRSVELSCIVCSGDEQLKREIFRRINTLGVPLSKYEVINGLFNGEYLRGLSAYVASDKGAIKVLGPNSRGKNQLRILEFLQLLHDRKPSQQSIYEWVSERKDASFANDQRKVDRNIDFIAAIFDDMSLLGIYFDLSMRYMKNQRLWVQHKKEINKAIKAYKKSDNWKLTASKAQDIEDIVMACVGGIELDPRRFFTAEQREELLEMAGEEDGKYPCAGCGKMFFADELQADHVDAWSKGGRTEVSNGQMLCRACNTAKSNA